MISLKIVFAILIIHWISDFILQTDKQAKGKSKNWNDLLSHTGIYSIFWSIPMIFLLYNENSIKWWLSISCFILITFITHTITDYFTSRLNNKLWFNVENYKKLKAEDKNNQEYYDKRIAKNTHNFFVSVGFDQVLHYVQLLLTYWYLTS